MTTFYIERLGMKGWYSFKKLPQKNSYIKIHALNCLTDENAMKQGWKILKMNNRVADLKII